MVLWFVRVVTWDGLLPICVIGITDLLAVLAPNNRLPIEISAFVLPVTGILVRVVAGRRYITNNCNNGFTDADFDVRNPAYRLRQGG